MIRAAGVIAAGEWSGPADDIVVLDYDERHRRRIVMKSEEGIEFLLDLPEAIPLRDGDALRLEDGRLVAIKAALEPLTRILAKAPEHLVRLAWHLGNRHLPAQIAADHIFIRRDHVIEDMLRRLGAIVLHVRAPFNPEGGAYAGDHDHDHGHEHHHHEHDHADEHGHGHHHAHDHDHDVEHRD